MIAIERNLNFHETNSTWDLYLPFIAAAHNNKKSRTTQLSPNELVYGKQIRLPHQIGINDIDKEINYRFKGYLNNLKRLNEQFARKHLRQYDEKRKEYFDQKQINKTFNLGDLVKYLKGPINIKNNEQLNPKRWNGIYRIIKVNPSGLSYEIQNIETNEIITNINIKKLVEYRNNNIDKQSTIIYDEEKEIEEHQSDYNTSIIANISTKQ
jgi:hypothetical protein